LTVTSSTPSSSLLGYSHIVRYNSRLYHVQTEDSGLDNPHITTHLFLNGMLMATLRCGYAGMLSVTDLEPQVCKLMQEQHRAMIRQLRRGELDGLIRAQAGTLRVVGGRFGTELSFNYFFAGINLSERYGAGGR